jgi:hypothetical protein
MKIKPFNHTRGNNGLITENPASEKRAGFLFSISLRDQINKGDKMKQIVLTLCVFFALITSTYAEELYNCIDSDGNAIITDTPQDGMKNCVLKNSYIKQSPEEPTNEKGKAIVEKDDAVAKAKVALKARNTRINNCIHCCDNKISSCYNYTADNRLCIAENKNCVATCNSEGASPSSWSDCWSQSDK